jgi:glutathione S-transferase
MTITLWGRATSANVQKVRWALHELALSYEHILVGGRFGGNDTPEYLAMNPNGLVPTIRDGDLTLWESNAIVRYLAATYGAGSIWPIDPKVRARVDQWVDWTATTFQPAWVDLFWRYYRTPEAKRDAEVIGRAKAETARCLGLLDRQLSRGAFVAGDSFTYADIPAGLPMFRLTTMGLGIDPPPNVERWHKELRTRAAFRDAVEVDYAELKGHLDF